MSVSVLVHLPDNTYHRAESLARLTSRNVADVLADTIEYSLPSVTIDSEYHPEMADLTDDDILARAEYEMEPAEDQRLSFLLSQQQDGSFAEKDRMELTALMQLYQEGLLRKAQALAEAVRRGLMNPMGA